jgi:hypothetical protein
MLALPFKIGPFVTIFGVSSQINHGKVFRGKFGFPVGDFEQAVNLKIIPPFTGGHTSLASNAYGRVYQLSVSRRHRFGCFQGPHRPQG